MQDRMQNPKYVLQIDEGVLMPKKIKDKSDYIRYAVGGIVILLILGSIVLGENLFKELGVLPQIFLVGLVFRFLILGESKIDTPSPIEILFFEDYLIVYRPKRYYSRRVTRREYNLMKYKEITRIKYRSDVRRFHIYGTIEGKFYNFGKDGMLETNPSYNRLVKDTMEYFSTRCTNDDDEHIMKTLETYIPLKIDIQH